MKTTPILRYLFLLFLGIVPTCPLLASGGPGDRMLIFVNDSPRYQLVGVWVDEKPVFKGFVSPGTESTEMEREAFSNNVAPSLLYLLPHGIAAGSTVRIMSSTGSSLSFTYNRENGARMYPDGLRMITICSRGSVVSASIPEIQDERFLSLFGDPPGNPKGEK